MSDQNSTGIAQSSQTASGVIAPTAVISSRSFTEAHLEYSRATVTDTQRSSPSLATDPKQKEQLIDSALRQQESLRLKQEQLKQFEKQESETTAKVAELKSVIAASQEKISNLQASYQEYKDSWKFWRAWTSEEDTLLQGLDREKELLKAHVERLKDFEKRQADFKQSKEEFLKLEEQSVSTNNGSQRKERLLAYMKAQSNSLDNLMVLDMVAVNHYKYREEHDHPRNAYEKMRDAAYDSFKSTKAGRFLIGVATVAKKVVDVVTEVVGDAAKFVTNPENWKKVVKGLEWLKNKAAEGLEWVGEKIKDGVVALGQGLKNAGKFLLNKAVEYITHPEKILSDLATAAVAIGKGIAYVGKGIYKAAEFVVSKAVDYALHPDHILRDIKNVASAVGSGLWKGVCLLGTGLQALGSGLLAVGKGLWNTTCIVAKAAWELATNPGKLIEAVKDVIKFGISAVKETLAIAGQFLVDPNAAWDRLCKNVDRFMTKTCNALGLKAVWDVTKSVLGFVKELSDSLGITSIIAGAANIITLPTRFLYQGSKAIIDGAKLLYNFTMGNCSLEQFSQGVSKVATSFASNMKEGLVQSARLFTGVYRLTMECTGLADIGRGIYYAAKGDWAMAGLHFGLGAANLGALAFTIVTAGAGAGAYAGIKAIQNSFKQAAIRLGESCLKTVGKGIGKVIGEEFVTKTGMTVLKREAIAVADELVEVCAKKGLSLSTVEGLAADVTKSRFKDLLEKSGLGDIVEARVKKALQTIIDHPSPKAMKKALSDVPELANLSKKELKAARELLISGKHTDEITKILTKEITDSVHNRIAPELEEVFAKRFRASLAGEVDTPAAKKLAMQVEKEAAEKGIPKSELIEQYVEKARTGFRNGLRQAIEEVVEAAIKRAIKSLKFPKESPARLMQEENERLERKLEKQLEKALAKIEKDLNKKEVKAEEAIAKKTAGEHGHLRQTRTERVVVDGKTYSAFFEQMDNGEWKNRGMTLIDEVKRATEKVAKAEDVQAVDFSGSKSNKKAA